MAISIAIYYDGDRVNDGSYALTRRELDGSGSREGAPRGYITGSVDLEAGAIGTATFTLPPGHPMNRRGHFQKRDPNHEVRICEIYPWGEEAELFRGWVIEAQRDTSLRLKVSCEGMLAYLKLTRVRPYACLAREDLPADTHIVNGDAFEYLVSQHNLWAPGYEFELGPSCYAGPVEAGTDYKTTWEELNAKFCDKLDRYLNACTAPSGNRCIELLDGGRGASTQAIVVGENVIDISMGESAMEVVTAIIPRGRTDDSYNASHNDRVDQRDFGLGESRTTVIHGKCSDVTIDGDRAVNWDMVEKYGYLEEKRDYDATDPESLAIAVAKDLDPEYLDERDVSSFDVQAADMHYIDPNVQPIRILDWAHVYIRADGLVEGDLKGKTVFDGWLPCTKIHFDLANPVNSVFHFGDIEPTFTRKSALRLGMVLSNAEGLVRRADGIPWNNDRFFNKAEQVESDMNAGDEALEDLIDQTSDQWSQHLDEQFDQATQQWYEHLDEAIDGVSKEDAQGREELLKHMEELEGKWSDEIGHIDQGLTDLTGTVDSNHRELLDGLRDLALDAQRTCFGICSTPSSTSRKTVSRSNLTRPGNEDFSLAKGVVVDVQFTYAHEGSATLNIADSGDYPIVTNGLSFATWHAGQVVQFVFDGSYWQACSTDIFASSVTVGHPQHANFYTNGDSAELRIGTTSYWHVGMDGERIGLLDRNHIDIQDDHIDFVRPSSILGPSTLRFSYSSYYTGAEISCDSGINIDGGYNHIRIGNDYGSFDVGTNAYNLTSISANQADGSSLSFGIGYNGYFTKGSNWIMRSITTQVSSSEYASFYPSSLGITSFAGYSVNVTNGDANALDFYVVGTQVTANWMAVKFDRVVNGRIRLNILAVPVGAVYQMSDPVLPGPEIFGDPESSETPEPTYEIPD